MKRQSRLRAGLPDGVLGGAGSTGQSVKETAVDKSDRIPVSREVLEVMLTAVREVREKFEASFAETGFEAGVLQGRAISRLADVEIALEALCSPQN